MKNWISLIVLCLFPVVAIGQYDIYNIQPTTGFSGLEIQAEIHLLGDTLYSAYDPGIAHIENGWLHFIEVISIQDKKGKTVSWLTLGPNIVLLPESNQPIDKVLIEYHLKNNYEDYKWPFGKDEAPYKDKDFFFLIGKAVFLFSDYSRSSLVHFVDGTEVETSWRKDKNDHYQVDEKSDLLQSIFTLGKKNKKELELGNARISIVSNTLNNDELELVGDYIKRLVNYYGDQLGGMPDKFGHYLIVITKIPGSFSYNGSAYNGGFSLVVPKTLNLSNLERWLPEIAHELLHNWIGLSITMENYAADQWFLEGFTEYLTWKYLVELEMIDAKLFTKKVKKGQKIYHNWSDKTSLRMAGQNKYRYKPFLYEGGVYVASELETYLSKESFDVTLTTLISKTYLEKNTPWEFEQLVAKWEEWANLPMRNFLINLID